MKTFIDELLDAVVNSTTKDTEDEGPTSPTEPTNNHNVTSESVGSLDDPDLSDTLGNSELN